MVTNILERDSAIHFPHFIVLKASAGSGKTYALTQRFTQFVLSDSVPSNNLKNILAITFTNNAAREMKVRILNWLKSLYFNDRDTIEEFSHILSIDRDTMIEKAHNLIEKILDTYSDFQVKTIDSFMTTLFKASAIDFGYQPDFEILMDHRHTLKYAFDLYIRNVRDGSDKAELFEEIISTVSESRKGSAAYIWDPSPVLLEEISNIYWKLSSLSKTPTIENPASGIADIKNRIEDGFEALEDSIVKSGLTRRSNSSYGSLLHMVREKRFSDMFGKGMTNPPVNKPPRRAPHESSQSYGAITMQWNELKELISEYAACYAYTFYIPYLHLYRDFSRVIDSVKKHQGKIFIEDINWRLSEYLDTSIVPDVYFRIGDTIFHYMIDEFQDTSPVQWKNLFPLIENSLSQNGSTFIVGDTKQAIYGFRNADYTIMKTCENNNPFPSSLHSVRELSMNYRSQQRILDFNETIFKASAQQNIQYRASAERSGLTSYTQKALDKKNDGYVEVTIVERNDHTPAEQLEIQNVIHSLRQRGYAYRDIAVLTQRNEDAVRVTTWLNEKGFPFISYSSLDIRRRKITGEIVSLLKFLNAPTDDLSFAAFILGDTFAKSISEQKDNTDIQSLHEFCFASRDIRPLYKSFQQNFGGLWENFFSVLFKYSGYLPLYDLLVQIYSVFRIFSICKEEEATLIKILEVVKDFEAAGYNSVADFLDFADKGEMNVTEWNMDVPKDTDAVTVMTVHKAKGLGFPVVIALLYEDKRRGFDYIIRESRDGVRLMKITQDIARNNPYLSEVYSEELQKDMVNRLNSLYVAFTRPQEELYVIGVAGKHVKYPIDLLKSEEFRKVRRPAKKLSMRQKTADAFRVSHHNKLIDYIPDTEESLNIQEKKRGEYIHHILFRIEFIEGEITQTVQNAIAKARDVPAPIYDTNAIMKSLVKLFQHKKFLLLFQKRQERIILREQDFLDRNGKLYRMDRVVVDPDTVTVIDYKTGTDKDMSAERKHIRQVKTYKKLLHEVFPERSVAGIIAYIDRQEIITLT